MRRYHKFVVSTMKVFLSNSLNSNYAIKGLPFCISTLKYSIFKNCSNFIIKAGVFIKICDILLVEFHGTITPQQKPKEKLKKKASIQPSQLSLPTPNFIANLIYLTQGAISEFFFSFFFLMGIVNINMSICFLLNLKI